MTRIIGVDPGLANTGWGIVESVPGRKRALAYGCITTESGLDRSQRLSLIHKGICEVIERYDPSELAVESVYFGVNATSALSIGEVRGVALLAAAEHQLLVQEYLPNQVKQTIVGQGLASKQQIQFMVQALLKLDHQPQPDHAADALAVALCHAQLRRIR
ncbi:MAG: crossover junction endodeoxyribonuclease RuvC [Coriobacteriia bacterium]|nr:crossover junction endodeoxyribonuclease RuvC [Coriobacteriia bacterium]